MSIVATLVFAALAFSSAADAGAPPPPSSYPSCGFFWKDLERATVNTLRTPSCILRARHERRRARATMAFLTIEGDPIVVYFFVDRRRPVLVVIDSTRDRFTAAEWTQLRCTRLYRSDYGLAWGGCRAIADRKPAWLKPISLR